MVLNRSSIFSVPADRLPVDEHGNLLPGYVLVTKPNLPLPPDALFAYPRHVINGQPGVDAPQIEGALTLESNQLAGAVASHGGALTEPVVLVVVDGTKTPWSPEGLVTAWPNGHKYVMEATIPQSGPMGPYFARVKIIEVPQGVTPAQTLLVPHEWAGEKFDPDADTTPSITPSPTPN